MKEPLELVFNRYIDTAKADPRPNCLSCYNFIMTKGAQRVKCRLTKWPGRELQDLLERREYTYLGRRAENCEKWEGE